MLDKLPCGHHVSEIDRVANALVEVLDRDRGCGICHVAGLADVVARIACMSSASDAEVMARIAKFHACVVEFAQARVSSPEVQVRMSKNRQRLSQAMYHKRQSEIADQNAKLKEQLGPLGIDIGPIQRGQT